MASQEAPIKKDKSQFFVINKAIRNNANVSNNEYMLLMNIHNLMTNQGKEWYEALERMSQNEFLAHLAQLVHTHKFSYKGAEEMLMRLQEAGFIIVEKLKVQVTEKWTDIVEENRGYLQDDETNEALLAKMEDMLKDIEIPKTKNFSNYKATVRKFVYEGKKAVKRKILNPKWQTALDKLEGLLKSDFLLKQFFEAQLKANGEADNPRPSAPSTSKPEYSNAEMQKNIDERLNWRINLSMTETMFFQELKNTKFWIELKGKRHLALTEAEQARLNWVDSALTHTEWAKAVYQDRIEKCKAEQAKQVPVDVSMPIAANVAAILAAANIKTV